MVHTEIRTTEEGVNEYLTQNNLMDESVLLEAALLQLEGTLSGQPCALLIATVDGKKRVIKTTLNMLIAITAGLKGGAEREGWKQPL